MGLRLYHAAGSPFVRKVMVVLHETRQLGRVEIVPSSGNPVAPGTNPLSINPLGKIPTLERDNGPALFDSRVICRFLGGDAPGLYPKGDALWESLTLEAMADGIMEAAVLIRYEGVTRPEEKQHAPWTDAQWGKIARTLDMLESRWIANLHGPFDIGQIALGCALGYLDFRFAERNWRDGHSSLAAWAEKVMARESFKASAPQG